MKKIAIFFISSFLTLTSFSQSIHGISFNNIDGGSVSLSTYEGKKIVFVIAPISISDSNKLKELQQFQFRFGVDSVKVIGVMSIEDGYSSTNNAAIKNLYLSRNINIVLTSGMYTKKSSGTSQSSLMKWLTEKDENLRYDFESQGIWQKFFVNKAGNLYGVVLPKYSLVDNNVIGVFYRN